MVNGIALAGDGRLAIFLSDLDARPAELEVVERRAAAHGLTPDEIEWVHAGPNVPCVRPCQGGDSLSRTTATTGTIACTVEDTRGEVFLLGCCHVFAPPPIGGKGMDVHWQPGDADGGTVADRIGTLYDYEPIDTAGGINYFDAALCQPDRGASCTSGLFSLGAIRGVNAAPAHNIPVSKVGWQKPRVTHGTLRYTKLSLAMPFPAGVAIFDDQYGVFGASVASPFAVPGDSGALAIDADHAAVGIVFGVAQGAGIAYVNPIKPILNRFQVTIQ